MTSDDPLSPHPQQTRPRMRWLPILEPDRAGRDLREGWIRPHARLDELLEVEGEVSAREDLLAVAELLDGDGWTQHVAARDSRRRTVGACAEDACQWCLSGAIQRVVRGTGNHYLGEDDNYKRSYALEQALDEAAVEAWDFSSIRPNDGSFLDPFVRWNDKRGRTQAEVVALVRAAAEHAA